MLKLLAVKSRRGGERDAGTGLDYRGARFYDSDVGRFLSLDPLAADFAALSPYNYVLGNPIYYIDPDGRKADDHIYLNQDGEEIARVENDEPDRYFVETTSTGSDGKEYRDFLEVNSPNTVKGDPKSQNPWDGTVVNLDTEELRTEITSRTSEMEKHVDRYSGSMANRMGGGGFGMVTGILLKIKEESQEGGDIDFVKKFTDGTIYNINGVHYNSHEGLNYMWGASLDKLGIHVNVAVEAAQYYHKSAYKRDKKKGGGRYTRVGPVNEKNHDKAIRKGYELF